MLTMRAALQGRIRVLAGVPLLLASTMAAEPVPASGEASRPDQIWFTENYYSDATLTVRVGRGYQTCDGEYGIISGYATPYSTIQYQTTCP